MAACASGHPDAAQILLKPEYLKAVAIDFADKNGITALYLAASEGSVEVV
jgi:hypothetical protein